MRYQPVLNKVDFGWRYRAGEFGNASPSWDNLGEFLSESREGLFHLRNGSVPGGLTHYKQTQESAAALWAKMDNPEGWYCSQQVPLEVEQTLLIQGEVMETERGLYLFSSTIAKPMREALATKAESTWRLLSNSLLRENLCPNSYDWLMELLVRYPSHVIEFSCFRRCWGTLYPKFNTVFWEIRSY